MKLKLMIDGDFQDRSNRSNRENVKIINSETGEMVEGVTKIELKLDANANICGELVLTIFDPILQINTDFELVKKGIAK